MRCLLVLLAALLSCHLQAQTGSPSTKTPSATPSYGTTGDGMKKTLDTCNRPIDRDATANRKSVDSRILTKGPDGKWVVEKQGSHGLYQQTSTVITKNEDGKLALSQKGTGIKDRSANRYATDMSLVIKYLKESQSFTYKITDGWGMPEELEKFKIGDCADKSNWLFDKLLKSSFDNLFFVCAAPSKLGDSGHAWVEVRVNGEDYILETTSKEEPINKKTNSLSKTRYYQGKYTKFWYCTRTSTGGKWVLGPPPSSPVRP